MVNNANLQFKSKYPYTVLFLLTILGIFNGVFSHYVSTFIIELIKFVLCIGLIREENDIKINERMGFFWIFFVLMSVVMLCIYFPSLHYALVVNIKNIIDSALHALTNLILLNYFITKRADKIIYHILSFSIVVEIVMYILYLMFNKIDGMIAKTNIHIIIMQDYDGRFQGSFIEPGAMGFWCGIAIISALILGKSKLKYVISALFLYILFTVCRAKFAVIALPAAFIIAFLFCAHVKIKSNVLESQKVIFFLLVIFSVGAYIFPVHIFGFISRTFGDTDSFSTRFYFIIAALRNIIIFPIGTGYGWSFEYFYKLLDGLKSSIFKAHMPVTELMSYTSDASAVGMSGKETFSYLTCSYGFIGLFLYAKIIYERLNSVYRKNYLCKTLILFIFIESLITWNIFDNSLFPFVLVSCMILNSFTEEADGEEKNNICRTTYCQANNRRRIGNIQ